MLSAILLIGIILTIIFAINDEELGFPLFLIGSDLFAELIVLVLLIHNTFVIPNQITMYQEENQKIETKIENTVEKYMNYEQNIIFEISPEDDAISLISLYPDLKSDKLIQAEIDNYISNNDKIKKLKADQSSISVLKFLLYFGH